LAVVSLTSESSDYGETMLLVVGNSVSAFSLAPLKVSPYLSPSRRESSRALTYKAALISFEFDFWC
jgi:hypothetical protein